MTTVAEAPQKVATPRLRWSAPGRIRTGGTEVLGLIERKLGVTSVGLLVVFLAVAVLVLSRVLSSRGMAMLGYGLILVLVLAWAMGRRNLPIEADRSELPSRVPAKRVVDAAITLTGRRRVSSIVVEEELDEQLGAPIRVPVAVLPAGQSMEHAYQFTPATRGIYHVGPLVAEFTDPFGLTRRRQKIAGPATLIVHPRVEGVIDRIISREWEDPPIRPPRSRPWPTGFEFYGMREYQYGDDTRRIVWRALAQYDKYLVRESEQGITDRVNIYLDSDAEFHARGKPSETFEAGVNVAASLADKHLKDGFSVCFDVNSGRLAKNLRGSGKRIPLLDEMSAIHPEKVELTTALDRLYVDPQRNAHNILITPHITQTSAARLRLLLDRGGSLIVVLLVWDDTDPMTLHRAAGLNCNIVEAIPGAPLAAVFQRVMGMTRR